MPQKFNADQAPYVTITNISGIPQELYPEKFENIKAGDKLFLNVMNRFCVEVTDNLEARAEETGERPKRTPSIAYDLNFIKDGAAVERPAVFVCEYRNNQKHSFFDDLYTTDAADYWRNQIKTELILNHSEEVLINGDPEDVEEQNYYQLTLSMAKINRHRLNAGETALLTIPNRDLYRESKSTCHIVHIPNSFIKKCDSIPGYCKISVPKDEKSWQYFLLPEEFIKKDLKNFCKQVTIPSGKNFQTIVTSRSTDGFQNNVIDNKNLINLINDGIRTYGNMIQKEASQNLQVIEDSPSLQDHQKRNIEKAIAEKLNPAPWNKMNNGNLYQNMNLIELDQRQNFFDQNVLIALGATADAGAKAPERALQSEKGR